MPHKYADIDESFKQFDRKLKEATLVQAGPRGSNKVSAIAEQLSGRNQEPEKPTAQKSVSNHHIMTDKVADNTSSCVSCEC